MLPPAHPDDSVETLLPSADESEKLHLKDLEAAHSSLDVPHQETRLQFGRRLAIKALQGFLITYAVVSILYALILTNGARAPYQSTVAHSDGCSCGPSIDTARKNGCKYDELQAAWLPSQCRDEELTRQFATLGPNVDGSWTYYRDSALTLPMGLEEVALADETPVFAPWEWHANHCLLLWQREHRCKQEGSFCDPHSDNEKHAKHCGMILLDKSRAGTRIMIS